MSSKICLALLFSSAFLFQISAANAEQFRVLMITKTDGWHHESIAAAVPALRKMALKHHFELVWEENVARMITTESLQNFDVLIFALTSGDILNDEQQKVVEAFIRSGKGFVGVHSASDTEYGWPWYTQLVGRSFNVHPAIQTAQLHVINTDFPGMESFPKKFWFTDEYYDFGKENVKGLNYLLTIDENTYSAAADWGDKSSKGMGKFHPLAWYQHFEGGRSFYTALGHLPAIYEDERFLEHLYGGIFWAATGRGAKSMGE